MIVIFLVWSLKIICYKTEFCFGFLIMILIKMKCESFKRFLSFVYKVSHQFIFRFLLFGQSDQKRKKLAVLFIYN